MFSYSRMTVAFSPSLEFWQLSKYRCMPGASEKGDANSPMDGWVGEWVSGWFLRGQTNKHRKRETNR